MKFVYVIASNPIGPCKIGISSTPSKRLKQLQTGHAEPLTLYHAQGFSDAIAKKIEKLLHKTLNHKRSKGEWFRLSVEEATAEVEFALIRYGDEPIYLFTA